MTLRRPADIGLAECKGCGNLWEQEYVDDAGYGPCCVSVEDEDLDYMKRPPSDKTILMSDPDVEAEDE